MKKFLIYFVAFIIVLGAGAFGMYYFISKNPATFQEIITKSEKNVQISENGISDSVEKVYDSVVTVSTYKDESPYSSGTGFVYKVDKETAYILTNAHVINNADNVMITFTNGNNVNVKVVGSDSLSDIAVLSVDKDKIISIASIGKSSVLRVGDTVFAVGAPLDSEYSWTVTRGILSGKDRLVEINNRKTNQSNYVMKVLQTDAAINSGNSGGPLANVNGEVIGITSLKLVSDGVEGIGFAIPIETAIKYADKIVSNEDIVYPYLGVSMINISEAMYYTIYKDFIKGYDKDYGVLVVSVEDDSPADKAGLKAGDIIYEFNGEKCNSVSYLRYSLYSHEVGDKIKVSYFRDGKKNTANLVLGKLKS